jgi:hypothetical protein
MISAAYYTVRSFWHSPKEDRSRQRLVTPVSGMYAMGGTGDLALSMYYNNR